MTRPPHTGSEGHDTATRAEEFIGQMFRISLLLYILLGVPFVVSYRSAGATWGDYSSRYLFGVLLPFMAMVLVVIFGTFARGPFSRIVVATIGRLPTAVGVTVAAFAIGAGAIYAMTISDEYVSVFLLLLLPCFVVLLWNAAYGGSNVTLAAIPILFLGVVLFGVEFFSSPGGALVVWGDHSTFTTLFPKDPPLIGEGGRLRPGLDVRMRAPEYRSGAVLVTNKAGFRNNREFASEKEEGELRILSLGDSFSTGFCANQDAFFGSMLEAKLSRAFPGRKVRVMNAEVSDPAYGLYYLQTHGMSFNPDIVIYGLSGNDVMQAEQFYGGDRLFRFNGEGRLERNPGFDLSVKSAWDRFSDFAYPSEGAGSAPTPRLAGMIMTKLIRFRVFSRLAEAALKTATRPVPIPGYADSYEAADGRKRLVDGASNLGFFYRSGGMPVDRMYSAFFDVLSAMQSTAAEGNASFLLVLHPYRYQVQPRDWDAMKQRWNLQGEDFDLTLWNRRIHEYTGDEGISTCDLNGAFAVAASEMNLYLPGGDTHYNRGGHEVAAGTAAQCIVEEDLTF